MSWLQATDADRQLVGRVREFQPQVWALARRLAPALRIEPRLLRNVRLAFLPDTDAGLEAELWNCPFIESHSARALTLKPGVARVLTDDLAERPDEYGDSLKLIESNTGHWHLRERLEQSMRLDARSPPLAATNALQEKLRQVLRDAMQAATVEERLDVARWAKGALPAVVDDGYGLPEADWLAQFAAASLGDPGGTLTRQSSNSAPIPSWLAEKAPIGNTEHALGLQWRPGVLECLSASEGKHTLHLTTPFPAPAFIRCEDSNDTGRWELLWPGRRIELPKQCRSLLIQPLVGLPQQLSQRTAETARRDQHAEPPRSIFILYAGDDERRAHALADLLKPLGLEARTLSLERFRSDEGTAEELYSQRGQAQVLRLWSRASQFHTEEVEATRVPGLKEAIIRLDDTPLPSGENKTKVLDARSWDGDTWGKEAEALAEAIRSTLREPTRTSPTHPTYNVFISHPKDARKWAERIAKRLGSAGITSEFVPKSGGFYETWSEPMEKSIQNAEITVAVITSHLDQRVVEEVEFASAQGQEIVFTQVEKELAPGLVSDVERVELFRGTPEVWEHFVSTVRKKLAEAGKRSLSSNTRGKESIQSGNIKSAKAHLVMRSAATFRGTVVTRRPWPENLADLEKEILDAATPPSRRLEIGDEFAKRGDTRRGVGLTESGLPDIDWVEIPAGRLLYGKDKKERELPAFFMSRYPVTNAQYQAFIDGRGYKDDRWWEGLSERIESSWNPQWRDANRSRETVSWYEAVAFCRWLSDRLGYEVRLPTEYEWEKVARGTDGRIYPWGSTYQPGHANVDENSAKAGPTDLGQTTAVGLYPQGASPYGVQDTAGNLWEWCLNEYENPDRTEPAGKALRALRGGSWLNDPESARVFVRRRHVPVSRSSDVGFRLCCSSPMPR